jgi:hypothetical protein
MVKLKAWAVALACLQLTCHQAILTAPAGSSLTLFANPPFIPAHGGVSIITAVVIEPAGTPVADGTVVQFFTTLGRIDEQGKTNDGVARVNLVSDARSGTATVTAISGGPAAAAPTPGTSPSPGASPSPGNGGGGGTGSGSVQVAIGSALPARVIVNASPSRITDSRSTHVFANVLDSVGNPVANVPVFFTVTTGSVVPDPSPSPSPAPSPSPPTSVIEEFFDSGGNPVFTDNNGRAEDVMRTRRARDASQKTVIVTATTANGISGSFIVAIN